MGFSLICHYHPVLSSPPKGAATFQKQQRNSTPSRGPPAGSGSQPLIRSEIPQVTGYLSVSPAPGHKSPEMPPLPVGSWRTGQPCPGAMDLVRDVDVCPAGHGHGHPVTVSSSSFQGH